MNWKYPITLTVIFTFLFSACKKESNPPNADSLKFATAKQGDTLILTGNNFNKDATVTLNGQDVTIVNATATELTIVIPDNATSGNITVTVNGRAMEIGALTIVPLTFYCLKHDLNDYRNEKYQIMTINPEDGSASLLLDITSISEFKDIHNLKYLPTTNEVVGLSYGNHKLLKINVTTKQTTILPLTNPSDGTFGDLILDKSGNLYSVKDGLHEDTLVKIDPVTGSYSSVLFTTGGWDRFVNISSDNEMISLLYSKWIIRTNLTTKKIVSRMELITDTYVYYGEMVAVGPELYGLKIDYTNNNNKYYLVKIDPVTGTQTTIKTLQPDEAYQYGWVYVPQRKAIYSIHNDANFSGVSLYRYNIDTRQFTASTPFTTLPDIGYYYLTSN